MIYIVRCNKGRSIKLPPNVKCEKNDALPCPLACDCKATICTSVDKFSVASVRIVDDAKAALMHVAEYGESESSAIWGTTHGVAEAPTREPQPAAAATTAQTASTDIEYDFSGGGEYDIFDVPSREDMLRSRDAELERFEVDQSIDRFVIRGVPMKIYTEDDGTVRGVKTHPLKDALAEIFRYWDTGLVFKNKFELTDSFIWLLVKTVDNVNKRDVDKILSDENYSLSQKFFYLFYDVVFKRTPPRGFYWCDEPFSMNPISPWFTDRHNFMEHFCGKGQGGARFREFYAKRQAEIVHYLHCSDEGKLFEDLTVTLARDNNEIVWIDEQNGYVPLRFGTVSEFITNMYTPTDLSNMKNMCAFLQRFRVTRACVLRRADVREKFEPPVDGGQREKNFTFAALGLKASSWHASEYDYYCALLREYVSAFAPAEININGLRLTTANFYGEVERVVRNFCQGYFVKADDYENREYAGQAFLLKSLCDRGVLKPFVNGCENSKISVLLELIENPNAEEYLRHVSNPVLRIDNKSVTAAEYVDGILDDALPTICGRLGSDEIVKAFFAVSLNGYRADDLNKMMEQCQSLYDTFSR